jgi:hypothetical protein
MHTPSKSIHMRALWNVRLQNLLFGLKFSIAFLTLAEWSTCSDSRLSPKYVKHLHWIQRHIALQ